MDARGNAFCRLSSRKSYLKKRESEQIIGRIKAIKERR
jgi:hypothetical protein